MLPLPNFVPGVGPLNAKLVCLGEAPGALEDRYGQPFVGPSGEILATWLEENGLSREQVYITNVVKYRPPKNKFKDLSLIGVSLDDSVRALMAELEAVYENNGAYCIAAMGNIPLKALTGNDKITKWRGSVLQSYDKKYKVVPMLHPANFVNGPDGYTRQPAQARIYTGLDFKRAVEQSASREYRIPIHNIQIGKRSIDVYRFLNLCKEKGLQKEGRAKGKIVVTCDIESSRCIPCMIAIAYDEYNAMSIPLVDIQGDKNPNGISLSEQREIVEQVARFLNDPDVFTVWQNGKYDHERLLNSLCINIRNVFFDTSLAAHTINPEFQKSLAFNQSIYTLSPFHKDEGKDIDFIKHEKKWVRDKTPLHVYNGKDTVVDYAIMRAQEKELKEYGLEEFFHGYVMRLHNFYRRMEGRGFKVNERKRLELLVKYLRWSKEIATELRELAGRPINCNDNRKGGQVFKFLYDTPENGGLGFKTGKDVKEDTLVMLIANHASHDKDPRRRRILFLISLKRRVDKTIGTYLLSPPDYDGRMRTVYRIAVTEEGKNGGTETGRTSTSLLKSPVRPEKMGMAFQTLTKHGDVGADVREILEADEGHVFISTDKSAAELRIALHLAEDPETLKKLDEIDFHIYTASLAFGMPMSSITKEDPIRHVGKTSRYLSLYDGQKNRLMHQVMSDMFRFGIDYYISEWKCGKVLEAIHNDTPKLKRIFHTGVISELEKSRTLINPYGRRRMFFADWGDALFREAYPYLCSSTTKDSLTKAMLNIEERKPDTLFLEESHDAFTIMVKEDEVDEYKAIIKEEMETPVNFANCSLPRGELVIPCETKVGRNYGQMKKI